MAITKDNTAKDKTTESNTASEMSKSMNKSTGEMMDKSMEKMDKSMMDKPKGDMNDAPDAEDITDVLMLLNMMDQQVGGTGEIAEIPDQMRNSLKYLIEQLVFVRDRFEDPMWMALLDDMKDQEEDGKTPSIEVAIARTIPMEKLMALADSEDYEGAQSMLSDEMSMKKKAEMDDMMDEESFEKSQKAGMDYAKEMGYDEERTNMLFQKVLDLYKVMGDGVLTMDEFAEIDKMLNYDDDMESMRTSLMTQDSKEVLPDQSSIDSSMMKKDVMPKTTPANTPGMASMNNPYENVGTDITEVGKRKRGL